MLRPKNYKEEIAKETKEMKTISDTMRICFRPQDWTQEERNDWNEKSQRYNLLAKSVGISKGYWKITL